MRREGGKREKDEKGGEKEDNHCWLLASKEILKLALATGSVANSTRQTVPQVSLVMSELHTTHTHLCFVVCQLFCTSTCRRWQSWRKHARCSKTASEDCDLIKQQLLKFSTDLAYMEE